MNMAIQKTFVGFGFGAIQGGLFLYEAHRSGNFGRLVVAEVVPEVVEAIRCSGGCYRVNVATRTGIEVHEVSKVEIYNPLVPDDAVKLATALAEASEICTALPSVDFFTRGEPSIASLIADAMRQKAADTSLPACIVYTAENHNHAAEILQAACEKHLDATARTPELSGSVAKPVGVQPLGCSGAEDKLKLELQRGVPISAEVPARTSDVVQFLNTVIGKMSGVVTDPAQIKADMLAGLTDGSSRALLVEEFNRILITQIRLPGFDRGVKVFIEKPDLLPFEEAKLYGHNATHALLGYLAQRKGHRFMSDVQNDRALMALGREAFLEESGAALIARHKGIDPLFTAAGYQAYTDDLLERMINPYLRDLIERVVRDPRRKLAWDDRLVGTMRLALDAGVQPRRFALGAAAAVDSLASPKPLAETLNELWPAADQPVGRKAQLISLITEAQTKLKTEKN
jgi:mannitol-1-phosphate 5-dehydrogenase